MTNLLAIPNPKDGKLVLGNAASGTMEMPNTAAIKLLLDAPPAANAIAISPDKPVFT